VILEMNPPAEIGVRGAPETLQTAEVGSEPVKLPVAPRRLWVILEMNPLANGTQRKAKEKGQGNEVTD